MRHKIIYIVIGLFIIALAIPTILWMRDYNFSVHSKLDSNVLSNYGSFISIIISIAALVLNFSLLNIAYKAFRNFDVKKQFHNKQLEIVSDLTNEISNTTLNAMFYKKLDKNELNVPEIKTGYTLHFFSLGINLDAEKIEKVYIATNNIENTLPFLRFRSNPLLPSTIAKALYKLYVPLHVQVTTDKVYPQQYVIIRPLKVDQDDFSKNWIYDYYPISNKFKEDSINLRLSIVDWFKEYGADNLNI